MPGENPVVASFQKPLDLSLLASLSALTNNQFYYVREFYTFKGVQKSSDDFLIGTITLQKKKDDHNITLQFKGRVQYHKLAG